MGGGSEIDAGVDALLGAELARSDEASASVLFREVEREEVEGRSGQLLPRLEPHISHLSMDGWLRKVHTLQARPSCFPVAPEAEGELETLCAGESLPSLEGVSLSEGRARSGTGVLVGVGRAGSFVTPHSSHDERPAALLKPQMAQTQFGPVTAATEESAAVAPTLQSRPAVALAGCKSAWDDSGLGRRGADVLCALFASRIRSVLDPSSVDSTLASVRVILGLLLRKPA